MKNIKNSLLLLFIFYNFSFTTDKKCIKLTIYSNESILYAHAIGSDNFFPGDREWIDSLVLFGDQAGYVYHELSKLKEKKALEIPEGYISFAFVFNFNDNSADTIYSSEMDYWTINGSIYQGAENIKALFYELLTNYEIIHFYDD